MMRAHTIREGMRVRTSDGARLGRVVLTGERTFQVEKGFFFPREYVARYADVSEVQGDEVTLTVSREELLRGLRHAGIGAAPPEVPQTQAPQDPREQRRLEDQLEHNRERQWAEAGPPLTPADARVEKRLRTTGSAQRRLSVERDTYRVGPDAPYPGAVRVRHKEYAIGYSEAVGDVIAFHAEHDTDSPRQTRQEAVFREDDRELEEPDARRPAPDMAGTHRGDPGERP